MVRRIRTKRNGTCNALTRPEAVGGAGTEGKERPAGRAHERVLPSARDGRRHTDTLYDARRCKERKGVRRRASFLVPVTETPRLSPPPREHMAIRCERRGVFAPARHRDDLAPCERGDGRRHAAVHLIAVPQAAAHTVPEREQGAASCNERGVAVPAGDADDDGARAHVAAIAVRGCSAP